MPTILFVCTANQIRSPIAEKILFQLIQEKELDGDWFVESAGTWASDDLPALSKAITAGAAQGIDLSGHRSRCISRDILKNADLVLTMESRQREALKVEFQNQENKIYMLSEIVDQSEIDVPDPVSGGPKEYSQTVINLQVMLENGFNRIIKTAEELALKNKDEMMDQ